MWNINAPQGCIPCAIFTKCIKFVPRLYALGVKISLDCLKGLWSYEVFNLTGSGYPQNFQRPHFRFRQRQNWIRQIRESGFGFVKSNTALISSYVQAQSQCALENHCQVRYKCSVVNNTLKEYWRQQYQYFYCFHFSVKHVASRLNTEHKQKSFLVLQFLSQS